MTRTTSIATVALALAAVTAAAQETAPFTLSGFVSLTTTANLNDPPDGFETSQPTIAINVIWVDADLRSR